MHRFNTIRTAALGTAFAGVLTLGGAGGALAQGAAEIPSHPAHIHAGDCANADPNPAAALNNVTVRYDVEDDEDDEVVGTLTAPSVLYSLSDEVDLNFEDDVLATAHSIIVHESEANIENYIACADIGGVVVDDILVVSLQPLNESGYSGIVMVSKDDDGMADVEVYLAEPATDPSEPTPTPAPTPTEVPATPAA